MRKENLKDPLVSWLSALLSLNSHNSGNFHLNEKNEISKLGSPLSNTKKHFRNQTKGICSLVDQTHDIFWYTWYLECYYQLKFY